MARGPAILLLSGVALGVGSVAALALAPNLTEALRWIIRGTARSSFALFLLAFIAAPLQTLWPSGAFTGLVRLRRWFGLSFALSHGVHAVAIYGLARHDPALFWTLTNFGSVISGGSAYGFILLMVLTSFDGAARWRNGGPWRWLHRIGLWYLLISFAVAFGKRIPVDPAYGVALALIAVAIGLRIGAFFTSRRTKAVFLAQR
ncbi:MAG: ferric reductase-like transmembrane domain-containing protein [Elstera sp.]